MISVPLNSEFLERSHWLVQSQLITKTINTIIQLLIYLHPALKLENISHLTESYESFYFVAISYSRREN